MPLCRDKIECGLLNQDVSFEFVEDPAGLDAELVDECATRALISRERVCLPARAVEREHLRSADPLAQWMLLCECRELAYELRMASQLQIRFDALFQRTEAQLLEASDRRLREGCVGEVRKREPAPQTQCLPQHCGSGGRFSVRRFLPQPFEPVQVELPGRQSQLVPGRSRHDRVGAQASPQL
jgi:hypothetical protein